VTERGCESKVTDTSHAAAQPAFGDTVAVGFGDACPGARIWMRLPRTPSSKIHRNGGRGQRSTLRRGEPCRATILLKALPSATAVLLSLLSFIYLAGRRSARRLAMRSTSSTDRTSFFEDQVRHVDCVVELSPRDGHVLGVPRHVRDVCIGVLDQLGSRAPRGRSEDELEPVDGRGVLGPVPQGGARSLLTTRVPNRMLVAQAMASRVTNGDAAVRWSDTENVENPASRPAAPARRAVRGHRTRQR
jgi:hypothetical protein